MKDWSIHKVRSFNKKIDQFVDVSDILAPPNLPRPNGQKQTENNGVLVEFLRGEYLFRIGIFNLSIYRGRIGETGSVTVYIKLGKNIETSFEVVESDWNVVEKYLIAVIKDVYASYLPLRKFNISKYKVKNLRDIKLISILHENQI